MTVAPAVLIIVIVAAFRLSRSPVAKARLRRWLRRVNPAAYWTRLRFDPAAYGLPPREELDPQRDGPEPAAEEEAERGAVVRAAWDRDWRPAAAYLEAAGEDWDERWSRTELLGAVARRDDAWLRAWREARPGSGDAATVHAELLVHRAWEIRGSGYAHQVTADRKAAFVDLLNTAISAARQAAKLAPKDPGPWVVMITAARGARYSHVRFEALWQELVGRAPHHYMGHVQALQYWCAKWAGSDVRMAAFAERALSAAPAGSPLAGLPLLALRELEQRYGGGVAYTYESLGQLARIAEVFADARPGDDRIPPLRHLLAYYLTEAGLYDTALTQFRQLGAWCGAEPWTGEPDAAAAFDQARAKAARKSTRKPVRTAAA